MAPTVASAATRHIAPQDLPRGGGGGTASFEPATTSTTATALPSTLFPTLITSALQSGPWGVVALSAVASSVVLPLTMIRQGYSFSVGYGFSVATMGLYTMKTFGIAPGTSPLSLLALGVVFYGVRLGAFLLLREFSVASKKEQVKSFDKTPRLKRIPLALSVSLFYAFLTSPLLYAARASGLDHPLSHVGVGVAWTGAIVEAVADAHKFLAKRANDDDASFVGPTGGFYRLVRHPNYFGEVVWWAGLALAGMPTFGKAPIPWICSLLGLYGIYGIMSGASKRLDGKQQEKYGGQEKYDTYRKQIPARLWPWIRSS